MVARLVTVSGYATSGKDSVADILVEEFGWYKTYMSKPLEQALLTLNPWVPWTGGDPQTNTYWARYSELHARVGYDESKKNPEVRRLLQTLGTEVGRKMFGEDTWLDIVDVEAQNKLASGINVVVTGVRYPNELAKFFRWSRSMSVWVDRPGVGPVNDHSSDNTLTPDEFDVVCNNDGTLEDLRAWVLKSFS